MCFPPLWKAGIRIQNIIFPYFLPSNGWSHLDTLPEMANGRRNWPRLVPPHNQHLPLVPLKLASCVGLELPQAPRWNWRWPVDAPNQVSSDQRTTPTKSPQNLRCHQAQTIELLRQLTPMGRRPWIHIKCHKTLQLNKTISIKINWVFYLIRIFGSYNVLISSAMFVCSPMFALHKFWSMDPGIAQILLETGKKQPINSCQVKNSIHKMQRYKSRDKSTTNQPMCYTTPVYIYIYPISTYINAMNNISKKSRQHLYHL